MGARDFLFSMFIQIYARAYPASFTVPTEDLSRG
jgi:hypothetical protein